MGSGGCGEDLIFPKCTQNESIAIGQLIATCPAELRQLVLDEIEGARQAGVIKTNLVPFARGVIKALVRGTFTVGHGPKVLEQRNRQLRKVIAVGKSQTCTSLDPKALTKGANFLEKISSLRVKSRA